MQGMEKTFRGEIFICQYSYSTLAINLWGKYFNVYHDFFFLDSRRSSIPETHTDMYLNR